MEKKQEEKNTEKVKKRTSLKNIIGGDILATDFFRRQAGLLFLIMVLIIIYINNLYECQLRVRASYLMSISSFLRLSISISCSWHS